MMSLSGSSYPKPLEGRQNHAIGSNLHVRVRYRCQNEVSRRRTDKMCFDSVLEIASKNLEARPESRQRVDG